MSLEENKAIVRRLNDAFDKHNWDLLHDLVAPEYCDHTSQLQGVDPIKERMKAGKVAFTDYHENIEDIIAEGDKVWVHVKTTATHTGEWMGIAPTGKKVTSEMVDIYRIVNGKHVEGRFITDSLDFLKKLGVIEYTEKGKKLFPEDAK